MNGDAATPQRPAPIQKTAKLLIYIMEKLASQGQSSNGIRPYADSSFKRRVRGQLFFLPALKYKIGKKSSVVNMFAVIADTVDIQFMIRIDCNLGIKAKDFQIVT
jgi:hypothetical protein